MGRPLYALVESEPLITAREQKRVRDALLVEARIRKWSPYAFNPDSDEFWQDAEEESFLSTDGLKEQMHEGHRSTARGPLIDSAPREEVGSVGIDWELVPLASHAISPPTPARSVEERNEGSISEDPESYPQPEVAGPDRSLRAYYFFDDLTAAPATISATEPRAGTSQARSLPLSPVLSYHAWNAAMSQGANDYTDLDRAIDLDFEDLRPGHQNNVIGADSSRHTTNARTISPANSYDHSLEGGPNERWVRGPLR